jgi:hypothetical protein
MMGINVDLNPQHRFLIRIAYLDPAICLKADPHQAFATNTEN